MPVKFMRNYKLLVDTINATLVGPSLPNTPSASASLEIAPPFSIEFNVTRTNESQVNFAHITILNLNLSTRTLIRKDWLPLSYRPVELWAGYSSGQLTAEEIIANPNANSSSLTGPSTAQIFPRIFRGNVVRAYSERQGVVFRTILECQDGGFNYATATFNAAFASGTPYVQIMEAFINAMPFCTIGAIDNFPGALQKGESFSGDPNKLLQDMVSQFGGSVYIDKELVYALLPGNYVNVAPPLTLSDANGLIGVPVKATTYVDVELMFEPGVTIGQRVNLQTTTVPYYNGIYTVCGISHKGIISPTVCGSLTTKLTLNNLAANSVAVQPWNSAA